MPAQIYSPDCDCPGGPDLNTGDSGGEGIYTQDFYLRADHAAIAHPAIVTIEWDSLTIKDEFYIYAPITVGGALGAVFSSGCVTGTGSGSVGIIAGLTLIRVIVIGHCDAGEAGTTAWTFTIRAEEDRCA